MGGSTRCMILGERGGSTSVAGCLSTNFFMLLVNFAVYGSLCGGLSGNLQGIYISRFLFAGTGSICENI